MWLSTCAYYVHQLIANFVCLLFDVEQVVHNEFSRAFSLKTGARSVELIGTVELVINCCVIPFLLFASKRAIGHLKVYIKLCLF